MLKMMNKWSAKRILLAGGAGGVLALTLIFTATPGNVSGAGLTAPAQQGGILDVIQREKMAIVGSWDTPDPEGVSGTITFHLDGTVTENDTDHTFSGGSGTWAYLGGRQFAYTFKQYKKDDQEQKGFVVVYGKVTLSGDGNHFAGPLHFEFSDETGKVVDNDTILGLNITFQGARIQVRQ